MSLLTLLLIPLAAAFPDRDATEVPQIGAGLAARGTWSQSAPLVLEARPDFGDAYWIGGTPVADGVFRAVVDAPTSGELALLVRATVGEGEPEDYSAYGVVLAPGSLGLWRWDQGVGLPLVPSTEGAWHAGHDRLEVVVVAAGPWLMVEVADADTLAPVAHLSVHDRTYRKGGIGVLATSTTTSPPAVHGLWVGRAADVPVEPGPFGDARLVTLRAADLPTLPRDLAALAVPDPIAPDQVDLVTDAIQAERIRHLVEPLAVTWEVPFRLEDPAYNAERASHPALLASLDLAATYLNPTQVAAVLHEAAATYPDHAVVRELGRSHEGRPILALVISDNPGAREDEPAVLLAGAHHGNELLSATYVLDAIQQLLVAPDDQARAWRDDLAIWCVPLVNPDAYARHLDVTTWAGRKNARDSNGDGTITPWDGADLNRNYPFRWGALGEAGSRSFHRMPMHRGAEPGSEPETRAVMALAEAERFTAAVSFHTHATVILSPYTIDGVDNPIPDVAWTLAEAMAAATPRQPSGKSYSVRRKLYGVDGTDQDWLFHTYGTLAYIVEGSAKNPVSPAVRKASVDGTRPTWRTLLARLHDGPVVHGHTVDRKGTPVEAEVRVEQITLRAGEVWTSRPADGRFERVLPQAGRYTVVATADGKTARRTVEVSGRTEVTLELK